MPDNNLTTQHAKIADRPATTAEKTAVTAAKAAVKTAYVTAVSGGKTPSRNVIGDSTPTPNNV